MLDIPRLAREAGLVLRGSGYGAEGDYSVSEAALERFAQLVAEVEREWCARVCEREYYRDCKAAAAIRRGPT